MADLDTLDILMKDIREEAQRLQHEGADHDEAFRDALVTATMKAVQALEAENVQYIEDHNFDDEQWSRMTATMTERVLEMRPGISQARAAAIAAMVEAHGRYLLWAREDEKKRQATTPAQPIEPPAKQGKIYFIQDINGGPIKIGFSTNVEERIKGLNYPGNLNVLALIDGDIAFEKRLHARFAVYRHKREWFEPSEELLAFIQEVASSNA